jgi:hypothetical protein
MTSRSGHHVAGSLAPGEAVAKVATHLSDGYFSTWPRQYRIFCEACSNGGPGRRLNWDWCQERTDSLDSGPDALRNVLAADPIREGSNFAIIDDQTALCLPRFSGLKSVVPVAARREVTLIVKALTFTVVQSSY